MNIRERLEVVVGSAIRRVFEEQQFDLKEIPPAALERPRDASHGDWACTVALRCAKRVDRNPRELAQLIIEALPENDFIDAQEIAGPGFINFRLSAHVFQEELRLVRKLKSNYGKGEVAEGGRRVNLEYVSANPTGPMHVGHGRWAALGDSLARVMEHAGYEVFEEFYVNDAGVQMDKFGESVVCRYLQRCGLDVEMPQDGYGGGYISELAQEIFDSDGMSWVDHEAKEREAAFREIGYGRMLELMKATLERFGNRFDYWFSERSLHVEAPDATTPLTRALSAMEERGYTYESEGATWFKSSAFGDEKDRVLVKANGEYTYFMGDLAYHYDKISRGFDSFINIWGADHHGYVPRMKAAMAAWGREGALEVVLGQLVNLFRGGEAVRMSKRTGEMVTFSELIDEVGVDATRFMMLSRSSDQPIDFDIELAKRQDSSNPVYYVQYAHARICSIMRKAAGEKQGEVVESLHDEAAVKDGAIDREGLVPRDVDLSGLTHESELALMRKIADFGDFVSSAARDRAPFRLTHYAQELAALLHRFYTNCKVLGEDEGLTRARLALIDACRTVFAITLDLLGVSAPRRM